MAKVDPGDNDYTDGCVYTYSTIMSRGKYFFTFSTSDGNHLVSIEPDLSCPFRDRVYIEAYSVVYSDVVLKRGIFSYDDLLDVKNYYDCNYSCADCAHIQEILGRALQYVPEENKTLGAAEIFLEYPCLTTVSGTQKEIKFSGEVIEPDNKLLDDQFDCKVKIDKIIETSGDISINVGDEVLVTKWWACGFNEPGAKLEPEIWNIENGDKVEVYGKISEGYFTSTGHSDSSFLVDLCGSDSYYFKISPSTTSCGEILEYAISDGTYTLPQTVMAHMKYKNYMKSPTKFKGVFLVKNQRTGKIYSCSKEQITNIDDRFGYGKGNSLQIRFEDEEEDIGVYDAKLELRNFYTDELCAETEWLEDQFSIDDGEEIKFNGTAIEYQRLIDTCYWTVDIDNVISGPQPSTNQLNVITWSSDPGIPRGYVDPNIKEGDKVEVYGEYRGDGPPVLLEGSEDYYIKVLSYCTTKIVTLHEGEVLDFKTGEVFKNGEQPWSEYQVGFSGNEIWGECAHFVDMGIVDICSSEPPPHSLKTYNLRHITPEVGHTYGVALGCPVKECIQIYIQACDGNSVTFEYEVEPAGLLVHNINTEKEFATIQAAIDDSDTEDGHTITVDPGTYNENVIVDKSITLQGMNYPVIDAGYTGDAVTITADGSVITGFNIIGGYDSGIIIESNKNIIESNVISNPMWYDGIQLYDSSGNTIINNTITNSSTAIFLHSSFNNTLTNNNMNLNGLGVRLDCSSKTSLIDNNIYLNQNGISVKGDNKQDYQHSIDTSNTVNGKPVYYFYNIHNQEISWKGSIHREPFHLTNKGSIHRELFLI